VSDAISSAASGATSAAATSALSSSATTAGVVSDTSRLQTPENLKAAGDKFEAIFTGMMLKSMRATHLAEDIFGSKAQDTFRDMQDTNLAKTMATHAPIGIGKAMTEYLAKAQANLNPTSPEPAK
jgi:flagellar protein FlgJ